jgi:hypothetical protein
LLSVLKTFPMFHRRKAAPVEHCRAQEERGQTAGALRE